MWVSKNADANKIDFIKDKRNSKKCLISADLVRIDIYLTCTPFFLFPRKRYYISCILSERTISTQYSNTILCNRTQFWRIRKQIQSKLNKTYINFYKKYTLTHPTLNIINDVIVSSDWSASVSWLTQHLANFQLSTCKIISLDEIFH